MILARLIVAWYFLERLLVVKVLSAKMPVTNVRVSLIMWCNTQANDRNL